MFALPILMTMETWSLGFAMERFRLVALMLALLPVLVGLAYFSGFEDTTQAIDAVLDAFAAIAVTTLMATLLLMLFGVLSSSADLNEWIGKIALQAVAARAFPLSTPSSMRSIILQESLVRREAGIR